MNMNVRIKDFFALTIGAAIVAAGVFFFMIPSNITPGSASALALVLSNFIPLRVSMITFIINALLLVIGYLLIGPEFGLKTVYTSLVMPAFMGLYEIVFPDFQSMTQDPLMDMLCYILVVGIGVAMLFSCNASSGGLDIVAKLMNKYLRIELGKAMSISGMMVALSAAFFYDLKTVVLSVLGTYLGGIVIDYFIFGLNMKRRVCILSPEFDRILNFILHELHSGATIYEGIGAYNMQSRKEIITIVDKQEYRKLMDYVRNLDPHAFITVYSVQEINYRPKR